MPASDLSARLGGSYMAARKSCEDLVKLGYVTRTRQTGKIVGRPEIIFSLSEKSAQLFPQCGPTFTLELLETMQRIHGENAPERLMFQYFQNLKTKYRAAVSAVGALPEKTLLLQDMRAADGCIWRIDEVTAEFARIFEYHNPLQAVFNKYPRVIQIEQGALGEIMDVKCSRTKLPSLKGEPARAVIEFELDGPAR